jgi:hypothetical protein
VKTRGEDAASLDGLGAGLFEFATFAGGSAVAAALLVVLVERAGLHWSTPLIALPVAGISLAVEPVAGVATGGAFIAATGVALARHQQSVERGGPEARRARERVGAISRARGGLARRRAEARRTDGARLVLGVRRDHGLATVPIGIHQGVRGFVPGAPGSGKTVTLAAHASAYVRAGMAAIVVDPKGDEYLRETLVAEAERAGKQLVEWSPDGPTSYNPLGQGSPSEIADKALAAETYTEPHYLRQAQRYLGLMLRAMREAGEWPPSLSAVVRYFEPDRLENLTCGCDEELAAYIAGYVRDMSTRARGELTGTRDRLAVLAESELGRWTEPGKRELDLAAILAGRDLAYIRLDADRFPLASQMLGAALVVDLVTISAGLHGGRPSGLVVVDEFAALAAEQISRLLSRSRSAGISVLIGTQSFADLTVARPDDHTDSLRRQVLANVDYVVAHRQSEPEAAEILASMAGTEPAWSVTRHTRSQLGASRPADEGTRTRTREFVCHPDEFKGLGVGEAIVIEPISGREPTVAAIWMPPTAAGGSA